MTSLGGFAAGGGAFLLLAAAANIAANASLRQAAQGIRGRDGVMAIVSGLLAQPVFWLGLAAAGGLLLSFTLALRETPVSLAYPIVTSLAIAGLLALDALVFGQAIGGRRLIGVGLIVAGVAVIFLAGPQS